MSIFLFTMAAFLGVACIAFYVSTRNWSKDRNVADGQQRISCVTWNDAQGRTKAEVLAAHSDTPLGGATKAAIHHGREMTEAWLESL